MKVKVVQLCPTLCDPIDYTVHRLLQARILEWVAFLFSRGSSQSRNRTRVSCIAGGFFTNWALRELPSLIFGFQPVWSLHVCGQQTVNFPRLVGVSVSRLAVEPDTNWLK